MAASKERMIKKEREEKAFFDYRLADAIGYSMGRLFNEKNKMPNLEEVYPEIFNDPKKQEEKQRAKNEISVLRFKQFARNLNKKLNKEVANKE